MVSGPMSFPGGQEDGGGILLSPVALGREGSTPIRSVVRVEG